MAVDRGHLRARAGAGDTCARRALGITDRTSFMLSGAQLGITVTSPLDDTLTALRAGGSHLAAVTGEAGAVLGFVTMEDVLTELVGPAPAAA